MSIRERIGRRAWPWIAGVAVLGLLSTWNPIPSHELPPNTPWHVLLDAGDLTTPAAVVSDTLRSLTQRPIRLTGFMYPLQQSRDQGRFLLSPHPSGCSFHVPGGPNSFVEVFSSEPVRFTYDPVAVQGRFDLAATEEGGLRYQVHEASVQELP